MAKNIRRPVKFFILVFLIISLNGLKAQVIFPQPLSERIASYDISVKLDAKKKMLEGEEILYWKNSSHDNVSELQFHLYLNAFKNTKSTFIRESRNKSTSSIKWGWIDIKSMQLRGGGDLMHNIEFIHPDDENRDDQTVIRVKLDKPVPPQSGIEVNIKFKAQLPEIIARTGYNENYFLVAQWFPKIGVYEFAGEHNAESEGWNCHQFHANSEFYADFGVYNVNITLPEKYVMGATGVLMRERLNKDSTITYFYRAEDVIDFAWAASLRFMSIEDKWEHVKIKLLIQPEHYDQTDRYLKAVKEALDYFDKNLGEYPYPNLTIVDPPIKGINSGGMEYPTLFTTISLWNLPEGIKGTEMVTIHEFGHNYFMGMLASNEFEEPWLDEGLNTYFENRIIDFVYGDKTSFIDIAGYHFGDLEISRANYTGMKNPKIAENARAAWEFPHGGYGLVTYFKTATWMATLDRMLGRETMDKIMKTYFERWKFKHPYGRDFIDIVNEITFNDHGNKFGADMNWFFEQVLYGSDVCDYQLAGISNEKIHSDKGIYDSAGVKLKYKTGKEKETKTSYKSKVILNRLGEVIMPVEVLIHFENGEEVLEYWDIQYNLPAGQARSYEFTYERPEKVEWAKIDPEHKILIDVNLINNSFTTDPETLPIWKYAAKVLFWVENFLLSFTMFF